MTYDQKMRNDFTPLGHPPLLLAEYTIARLTRIVSKTLRTKHSICWKIYGNVENAITIIATDIIMRCKEGQWNPNKGKFVTFVITYTRYALMNANDKLYTKQRKQTVHLSQLTLLQQYAMESIFYAKTTLSKEYVNAIDYVYELYEVVPDNLHWILDDFRAEYTLNELAKKYDMTEEGISYHRRKLYEYLKNSGYPVIAGDKQREAYYKSTKREYSSDGRG